MCATSITSQPVSKFHNFLLGLRFDIVALHSHLRALACERRKLCYRAAINVIDAEVLPLTVPVRGIFWKSMSYRYSCTAPSVVPGVRGVFTNPSLFGHGNAIGRDPLLRL